MKRIIINLVLISICILTITGCHNFNKTKLVENVEYFVRGEFKGNYLDISKRGYYVDSLNQDDAPYYYIICSGKKISGGYALKIKEVSKNNNQTEIIVEEIAPSKSEIVTMAITYPTIIVEFPKYQDNIVIKNTKGELFSKLKDY